MLNDANQQNCWAASDRHHCHYCHLLCYDPGADTFSRKGLEQQVHTMPTLDRQGHAKLEAVLRYEWNLLLYAAEQLYANRERQHLLAVGAWSGWVENLAIHARNLTEFLFFPKHPKYEGNIRAFELLADPPGWRSRYNQGYLEKELPELNQDYDRASRQVNHINLDRIKAEDGDWNWEVGRIVDDLRKHLTLWEGLAQAGGLYPYKVLPIITDTHAEANDERSHITAATTAWNLRAKTSP